MNLFRLCMESAHAHYYWCLSATADSELPTRVHTLNYIHCWVDDIHDLHHQYFVWVYVFA